MKMGVSIVYLIDEASKFEIQAFDHDLFEIELISSKKEFDNYLKFKDCEILLIDLFSLSTDILKYIYELKNAEKIKRLHYMNGQKQDLTTLMSNITGKILKKETSSVLLNKKLIYEAVSDFTDSTNLINDGLSKSQNRDLEFMISQMLLVD